MKTKKAATAAGYYSAQELHAGKWRGDNLRAPMTPIHGENPVLVKGENRWHVSQCEPLLSVTAAAKRGLKLRESETQPTATHSFNPGRKVEYPLYRLSEFIVKPARLIPHSEKS